MAKRRRKSAAKHHRVTVAARFAVGTAVRVQPGVADPDYPDIPLGGWSGVVERIDRRGSSPTYLIAWNEHTLEQMHPVFRGRCERDDLDAESMWLAESDLEPDTGAPTAIEQPTQLVARPLRLHNRADRIRMVFGLTSDDALPTVSRAALRCYHAYLAERLTFPFPANALAFESESTAMVRDHRFEVTGLLDPNDADVEIGLLCMATEDAKTHDVPLMILKVPARHGNRVLIDDYAYWIENWPADGDEWEDEGTSDVPAAIPERLSFSLILWRTVVCAVAAAGYGAILGGAIGAVTQAGLAAEIGAGVLGLIGLLIGMGPGFAGAHAGRAGIARVCRVLAAAIAPAAVGGLLATLLVVLIAAFPGALIGGLVGAIVGGLAARRRTPTTWSLIGALSAGAIGSYVLAVAREPADALRGALYGAAIAAAGGVSLYFAQLGMRAAVRKPED